MNEKTSLKNMTNILNERINEGLSIKKEIIEISNLSQKAKKFIKLAELVGEDSNFDEINLIKKNNAARYNHKLKTIGKIM